MAVRVPPRHISYSNLKVRLVSQRGVINQTLRFCRRYMTEHINQGSSIDVALRANEPRLGQPSAAERGMRGGGVVNRAK